MSAKKKKNDNFTAVFALKLVFKMANDEFISFELFLNNNYLFSVDKG